MDRPFRLALLATLAALSSLVVIAQQQPPAQQQPRDQQQDQPEEPGRAVARISVINGDVSVRRGDSGDLIAAAVNAPLQVQDRLLTGPASRAEIQLDFANFIRVGASAEVRMAELEYGRSQIQLAAGTITFRVLRDSEAQIEIATPNVAIHSLRRGAYRIAVTPDGVTEIMVRSGEAEIFSPNGSEPIRQGQMMLVRGNGDNPEFQLLSARGGDEWDRWNDNRDRELESSKSTQYVPRDVYGAEDLDQHGRWDHDPAYGNVWVPQATPDWAPYRNGRWAWEDYYGWTWVSYDSWGWAPYHWGSWYQRPGIGWCWFPGSGIGRHFWRPAVVGFFGWGGGGGGGFGFGNVGWVPLAPYERFHPWYGRGIYAGYRNGGFGGHTTIINNTNVYNTYRNARGLNGVTSMPSGRFGRGGVDNRNFVRSSQRDIQQAGLVRGQLPVSPDRNSTRFADREPRGGQMPRSNDSTRFISRRQPTQMSRVPFDQQQRGLENGVRQGAFNRPRDASFDRAGGPVNVDRQGTPNPSAPTGWRRLNESPRGGAVDQNSNPQNGGFARGRPAPSANGQPANPGGGWRRFEDRPTGGNPGARTADPNTRGGWGRVGDGTQRDSGDRNRGGYTFPSGRSRDTGNPDVYRSRDGSQQQPVRINPQIVRERPQSNDNPSPRPFGGNEGRPRDYSSPRNYGGDRNSPASRPPSGGAGGNYSSPRPSGGGGNAAPQQGGGGGSRPSGGGSGPRPSGGDRPNRGR